MNSNYEQEIRYRLLKILSDEPKLGQREMAKRMGISLGKVNYCISELASKGCIKIHRFKNARNKIPYTYMLTPRGLEEKGKLTISFLKRKIAEYHEIKKQIGRLHREFQDEGLEESDHELSHAVKGII